jgi:MFS family permease
VWVFPLGAAIVSAIFAALIAQQWISRKRPHQLAWALALLMFAIASFAAALGILGDWNPTLFRTYYLFGAIINVPFLAAGTVYLLAPRWIGAFFMLSVLVGAVFAAGAIFSASLQESALGVSGIPSGRQVLAPTSLPRTLSRYYSYTGFVIVIGGTLWSSWRLSRQRSEHLRNLTMGNVLIALGTAVVAAASAFARFGRGSIFAVGLLIGVTVMFAGFLRTRPRPEADTQPSAEPTAGQ